jgi:hypothetical protein
MIVNKLPQLRPISYKNKKHRYKLNKNTQGRRKAINESIKIARKKTKKNIKAAALAKKRRLNVLRIYRRYKNPKECEILTRDMKYLDKKYEVGHTKNICGKTKKN